MRKKCPHPKTCPVESKQCNGIDTNLCADKILVEYYLLKTKMDNLIGEHQELQRRYRRVCSEFADISDKYTEMEKSFMYYWNKERERGM